MENTQTFNRGNLVRIAKDLGQSMSHFENDKEVIIVGSYADQYGGSDRTSYTVMFPDNGNTSSWYNEHQLTLVDIGGEHLITEAKKRREEVSKQNKDLNLIIKNWEKNEWKLSSETILFLFDKIGYKTSFLRNGEYFILFADWHDVYPFVDLVVKSKTLEEATNFIDNKTPSEIIDKVTSFWNDVKTIQAGGVV